MKIGIFRNVLILFPSIILVILVFSYREIDLENENLISENIVLKSSPKLFNYYKSNRDYYELKSQNNSIYKIKPKLLKPTRKDSILWKEFKNLKKGDEIFITYYNSARKNVKTPYNRVVHLVYKNKVLIDKSNVQKSAQISYFIVIGLMILIMLIGLCQEFKHFQILKSSN